MGGSELTGQDYKSNLNDSLNQNKSRNKITIENPVQDQQFMIGDIVRNCSQSLDTEKSNQNFNRNKINTRKYSVISEEQELSLLSNLNIDSSISEISFISDCNSLSELLSVNKNEKICDNKLDTISTDQINLLNLNSNCIKITENNVNCDVSCNIKMGNDLSASGSNISNKFKSGNFNLNNETNFILTGNNNKETILNNTTMSDKQPTFQRLQNFLFNKSNENEQSFDAISSSVSSHQQQSSQITSNPTDITHMDGKLMEKTEILPDIDTELLPDGNNLNEKYPRNESYPITSPHNPFLPEIIAKNYATDEDEDDYDNNENKNDTIDQFNSNLIKLHAIDKNSISLNNSPNKMKTDSIRNYDLKSTNPKNKQKKLFTLSSPETETLKFSNLFSKISPQSSIKKKFNPFSRHHNELSEFDLNAKHEEFLRATMKICLVVSPPSSRLQLKSKSLTHLDVLDSLVAFNQGTAPVQKAYSDHSDVSSDLPVKSNNSNDCISPITVQCTCNNSVLDRKSINDFKQNQLAETSNSKLCNKNNCCFGQNLNTNNNNNNNNHNTNLNMSNGNDNDNNIASNNKIGATGFNSDCCLTSSHNTQSQLNLNLHRDDSMKKKPSYLTKKKPLLTRSEVSNSEYFSVIFYTEAGCGEEELFPAVKGKTLLEVLNSSLQKRNLNFSQICISGDNYQYFPETESPPYTSALNENTNVEALAGRCLTITEKENSNINKRTGTLHKAASFGSRSRPQRILSSASTEENTLENEQKIIPGKQLKQRWSGLFGIKNPQQVQLCELLNKYDKEGVPQKSSNMPTDHPNYFAIEYLQNVHKSWRDFVSYENITENEMKIQSAIWELVSTEIDYIHALKTVTDLFLACLESIQKNYILTEIDQMKLFSNIREICDANIKFWTQYLYPMVAHSIQTKCLLCIDFFQPGFVTFSTTFSPYKKYCAEQSTCQYYCKELNRTNSIFTSYLAWCESQKMCNRLRLADILVRPMQRLTKYSLLLTAIRKHIVDENDADIIDSMVHSVENFVYSVNTHLTTRQENERLKGIMARIETYDVVDMSNEQLEKFSRQYFQMFDLCAPMKGCSPTQGRHLFIEGDLKLKDNMGKVDVHCFLLTDILLICKTIAKKGLGTLKVVRQPYLTDRLVTKLKDNILYCVYLNEFQVAVAAFTLQCGEAKSWHDGLTKSKHIYSRLKQDPNWDNYSLRGYGQSTSSENANMLGVKKSPMNSSIGSRMSSLNNSHSGSIELNDSRNISVDFEKANSISSDEGSNINNPTTQIPKVYANAVKQQQPQLAQKIGTANTLTVQPLTNLGQSLPNLTLPSSQVSANTLHVPGNTTSHSGNNLLSPSHRGISYPPPSPTRATLRRGFAFSSSIKNPPLMKTRNITSQNSINFHQALNTASPSTSNQQLSASTANQPINNNNIPLMTTGLKINHETDA